MVRHHPQKRGQKRDDEGRRRIHPGPCRRTPVGHDRGGEIDRENKGGVQRGQG